MIVYQYTHVTWDEQAEYFFNIDNNVIYHGTGEIGNETPHKKDTLVYKE